MFYVTKQVILIFAIIFNGKTTFTKSHKRKRDKLCYVMLCILYLKSMHKIVYNKKLINIDWLMLHSLQETKCDPLLLLLLLQPTQTKFKQQPQQQQKTTQFQYENSTKASRLHFSNLQ